MKPFMAPRAAATRCMTSAQLFSPSSARSTASIWPRMRRTRCRSLVFSRIVWAMNFLNLIPYPPICTASPIRLGLLQTLRHWGVAARAFVAGSASTYLASAMAQATERIGETFGIDFLPGPGGELMSSAHSPGPGPVRDTHPHSLFWLRRRDLPILRILRERSGVGWSAPPARTNRDRHHTRRLRYRLAGNCRDVRRDRIRRYRCRT